MGDKVTLTIEEILGINEAILAIGDKETLSATVAYRLGRLKKYAEGISKEFNRTKNYKIDSYNKAIVAPGLTEEEKLELRKKLQSELDQLTEDVEEIKVPELKLSDFMDEKGKLLVPQKFISLMGELIKDDKDTGDYSSLIRKDILVSENGKE